MPRLAVVTAQHAHLAIGPRPVAACLDQKYCRSRPPSVCAPQQFDDLRVAPGSVHGHATRGKERERPQCTAGDYCSCRFMFTSASPIRSLWSRENPIALPATSAASASLRPTRSRRNSASRSRRGGLECQGLGEQPAPATEALVPTPGRDPRHRTSCRNARSPACPRPASWRHRLGRDQCRRRGF